MHSVGVGQAELKRIHHLFLATVSAIVAFFLLWSWLARLDIVATAPGRVEPSGRLKTIQHLEGGIVQEILVREGDRVRRDQPLLILEKTGSSTDVAGLNASVTALQADIARYEAEAGGTRSVIFSAVLLKTAPAEVRESRELFRARQDELASALAGLQEQISQRQRDISSSLERIKAGEEALALTEKQRAISSDLLRENLTTQYKHLALEREVAKIRGELAEERVALERARSMQKEAQQKHQQKRQAFVAEAAENLKKARSRLQEGSIHLRKFEDSLLRTEVRSPVDGIVKTVHIVTKGGVVKPGMAVMDIVPAGDRLVVEALLPVDEIGYVRAGQRADVRLVSSDSRLFGKISGTVVHVSPDAVNSQSSNASYYTFRVETDTDAFARGVNRYRLYPGMQVAVSIHIGTRSVMGYLLDPFFNSLAFTFQER